MHDIDSIETLIAEQEQEEDMLQGYATTPQAKGAGKRLHTTPDEATNKRTLSLRTPVSSIAEFSPDSYSPAVATPTPKYDSRKNKGETVVSYGCSQGSGSQVKWHGTGNTIVIKPLDEESTLTKCYKYMFQKISDKADTLDNMIDALADQMKINFQLADFCNVNQQSQDSITIAGRVCCDAVGKLNSKSILLEGSRETSNGCRIPLDVSEIQAFSLFPGQILTAEGVNSSGGRFFTSKIHDGQRLPFYSTNTEQKDKIINEDHFTIYIACGPFATSDTQSYTPLTDLLKVVNDERPDLLVLLGPFVDSKQVATQTAEHDVPFDDKFQDCINEIVMSCLKSGCHVTFVPSQRDIFHEFVYPQPPFEPRFTAIIDKSEKLKGKTYFMSDPSTITINDIVVGITSTDILFHLGAEETSSFAAGSSDRLGRLAGHVLKQQCYYPLHPPSEDVNLDYANFGIHCFMAVTPDILILPSDLRFFVKDVDGCLCINPGRLVKGQTGGTFAKILVKPNRIPNADKSIALSNSIVQIVRL